MKHITLLQYVELECLREMQDQCRNAAHEAMCVLRMTDELAEKWWRARDALRRFEFDLTCLGCGHYDPPGCFNPNLPVEWPVRPVRPHIAIGALWW